MRPIVDDDLCIGCGLCEEIAPEVFQLGDDGIARVIDKDPPEDLYAQVEESVESCPTDAITTEE